MRKRSSKFKVGSWLRQKDIVVKVDFCGLLKNVFTVLSDSVVIPGKRLGGRALLFPL